MAPPARAERADTSEGRKPRRGPIRAAETRIVSVIKEEETWHHRLRMTAQRGV